MATRTGATEWAAAIVAFGALLFAGASPVVAIVAAVVLSRLARQATERITHSNPGNCKDPDCVRCSTYHAVTQLATDRLEWYGGVVSARFREGLSLASGEIPTPSLSEVSEQDVDALGLIARMGAPGPTWVQQPSVLFVPYLRATPFVAYAPPGPPSQWPFEQSPASTERESDACPSSTTPPQPAPLLAGASPRKAAICGQSLVRRIPHDLHQQLLTDLQAAEARPEGWKRNSTSKGEWRVFHLVNQGVRVEAACLACPTATALAESLACDRDHNALATVFGNAFFSVLTGPSEIDAHCGPTNARLRVQLAIRAGAEKSTLTVAGDSVSLAEGEAVCFDDSFTHSAAFSPPDPTATRALFIVDIMSPHLTKDECVLLAHTYAPAMFG
eukprot:m.6468 g.6468  ORF g.6468 m.6468 type:complete len:387 (+) comp3840_c0_seq1:3144-4304(+)